MPHQVSVTLELKSELINLVKASLETSTASTLAEVLRGEVVLLVRSSSTKSHGLVLERYLKVLKTTCY